MTKAKQKWDKFVSGQESKGRKRRASLFLTDDEHAQSLAFIEEIRKMNDPDKTEIDVLDVILLPQCVQLYRKAKCAKDGPWEEYSGRSGDDMHYWYAIVDTRAG